MSKKFLSGLSVGAQTFTTSGLSNIANMSFTGILDGPYVTPAQIYASAASVTGDISINPSNGTFDGTLSLGSANTTTYLSGNTFIYDSTNSWGASFSVGSLTASRSFAFQNNSGTLALTAGNNSLSANTISGTTASFTATGTFNAVVATTVTATTVNATTVNATTATLTGKLSLATTATNRASVNIPASGTVPTSGNYVTGDMWVSGTSLIFATATNASKTTMWTDLSNAASPTNNSLSLGSGSLTATAVTATTVTATTVTATTVNGTTVQMNSVSATSAATNNALVIRDGSGNFSANIITATTVNHTSDIQLNGTSIVSAWSTFTPVMTNWTKGSGTFDSFYTQIGKTVTWRCKFTLSGTTVSGNPILTLPVTAKVGGAYYFPHQAMVLSGGAAFSGTGYLNATTTWSMTIGNAAGTYASFTSMSSTIPGTWANADHFNFVVTYEAA